MPELIDPREERACQLRASGKTQVAAYDEAFEVPSESGANNSSRFFRQAYVRTRVDEIKRRRAVLADLDDAWVLRQLKAIGKNGELIGDANLDDYFHHNASGQRVGIALADVSRAKMAALEEVTIEQYTEGSGEDIQTVKKTKIKLRSAANELRAVELIGKHLGMWPNKIGLTNPNGDGPVEVTWKQPAAA